ncbi:hypothetical protein KKF91_12605 [Myxococcota bacterium]|nr:hypothetical protein [Myxococcota bacterium]
MISALSSVLFLSASLLAVPEPSPRFRFAQPPQSTRDIYLWPLNLHLGYGSTFDAQGAASGLSIGVDVGIFSYNALSVDTLSMRFLLRDSCAHQRECGLSSDVFIGTRPSYAFFFGEKRKFQLGIGCGVGIGAVGEGWSGRRGGGSPQSLISPSLRASLYGLLGFEIATLAPLTGSFGDDYPMSIMFNILGGGVFLFALGK